MTPPIRQARIAVILSSVTITLLLLRDNHIPLYQSSNFVLSPSNHFRLGTILFGIPTYLLCTAGTSAINIISVVSVSVVLSKAFSLVILNNPSCSDNASKLLS